MNVSLRKNVDGIAHLALIIGAVVVLVIGGAGYLVFSKQKDKDASTSTSLSSANGAEVTAECKTIIDDDDFCKFAGNYNVLNGSYKMVLTTTSEGDTSVSTIETDGNNNTHMVVKSNGQEQIESIYLDKVSYIKDSTDGAWTKYPDTSSDQAVTFNLDEEIEFDFEADVPEAQRTQYKKIGTEACGSLTCFKYQIIDPADTSLTEYLWFDTDDYLLRRYTTTKDGTSTDMSVEYTNVTIKAPTPVKDPPTGALSQEEINSMMQQYGGQ